MIKISDKHFGANQNVRVFIFIKFFY